MSETPETVTIELPDGAKAGWPALVDALERAKTLTGFDLVFGGLIEQIDRQTKDKIAEPQGLGAVVADRDGQRYTKCDPGDVGCAWYGPGWRSWEDIDAVTLVSEGV